MSRKHRLALGFADRMRNVEVELPDDEPRPWDGSFRAKTVGKATPRIEGARVVGTITDQGRGPKLTVFKMKRRKGYRRKQGHRQDYTEVRVDAIEG